MRYSGRKFSSSELEYIRSFIADNPDYNRARLSRAVCEALSWRRLDGRLKDMSCRVAMLRMQDDGLIQLPPPQNGNNNGRPYLRRTLFTEPEPPIYASSPKYLDNLHLNLVSDRNESHLWNEYIERYHYLGYQPLPGAQMRYFARAGDRVVALIGFGAAAWKTAPRDRFIGWTSKQRELNLNLIVNNARFLILPWVNCRNLASRLLGIAAKNIVDDWQKRYSYQPVLLETFVEIPRFRGTAYKAANWIHLGQTKGRGKLDVKHEASIPKKSVWIFPIVKDFRDRLCA